ncbi:hypothetical protein BD310DRAFT_939996 [Dichomitus squalens]|uniref:Uncharacterized protein n=1 Tax=Dichomitus squalens TaxID=114155 RepID=A0A4Q9PCP6_9APHY|nr:hypothetical protein BD310DRAFT_939996 [Dichomitus squalens]
MQGATAASSKGSKMIKMSGRSIGACLLIIILLSLLIDDADSRLTTQSTACHFASPALNSHFQNPPLLDVATASLLHHPLQRPNSTTCPLGSDVCELCHECCSY